MFIGPSQNDCHKDNGLSFYETTYVQLLISIDYFSVSTSIYNTILFQCKHVSHNITTKIISGHILYNFHFFKLTCDSQKEGRITAQVQTKTQPSMMGKRSVGRKEAGRKYGTSKGL